MPSDRYATVHVELLDTDEVKEILRAIGAENKHLRERVRELQRVLLEMYAVLDHSAEERGETCWSCFLQGEANKLFEGYDPARYDGDVSDAAL